MGTLLGKQLGNGFADTTAGAGDQGYLAVEIKKLGLLHGGILVVCGPAGPSERVQPYPVLAGEVLMQSANLIHHHARNKDVGV
ncbi:hypothetical protein NBRC116187_08400 [Halopseudomonas sabulinigri]|uniref:Uncharacterized protein n=1 Tax=Halopseudomonas sabulinigri TaxID=472181 RepID=A0ABP9ZM02_9GAMM